MDEAEGCDAHPTEVAAAHAHDRSFVRPLAGANHGIVSATAGARFWHCDRQSDQVCIGARRNGEHAELNAHGARSMIASAATRCVGYVPSERWSAVKASKPSRPRFKMKPAHLLPS